MSSIPAPPQPPRHLPSHDADHTLTLITTSWYWRWGHGHGEVWGTLGCTALLSMNTEYPPDYSVFTKEAYFCPPAKLHRYLTFITVWTFCSRDKDREIITMARGWCWGVEIMALFSSGSSDDLQRRFLASISISIPRTCLTMPCFIFGPFVDCHCLRMATFD